MRLAIIVFVMLLTFGTITSYGTVDKDKAYGYTVTFYAGLQGHFGSDVNTKTITKTYPAGEKIIISLDKLDFHLDNPEYYAKGLRLTGHDNDEWSNITSKQITVDEDMAFEVAYGLEGGMVAYTVNYVSAKDGTELHPSDTYYGMVGDKPVVSYKYVEKYLSDAYNKGKRLTKDESQNVFTFTYTYTGKSGGVQTDGNDNSANGNGQTGQATQGAVGQNAAGATDNGTNTAAIGDNDAPKAAPKDYVDIDDPEAPLAGNDEEISSGRSALPFIAGGCGALLLIVAAALLMRRRNNQ